MTDSLLDIERKALDPARYSVQGRADSQQMVWGSDVSGGMLFIGFGQQMDDTPEWNALYPNRRDRYLRWFSRQEPMLAAAIQSLKMRIQTLNTKLNGPPRAKAFSQKLLNNPGLGDNLIQVVGKFIDDILDSDNGGFIEKWMPGRPDRPPPKGSPVLGFGQLDSRQCWRSFDPEFPVWYTNPATGEIRKLHKDRVIMQSANPQPIELARNIGFCPTSQALRLAKIMRSTQIYRDEKISGGFTRALGSITGVTAKQVKDALRNNADEADSKGFVVYKGIPFLLRPGVEQGSATDIKIALQDLASIPDGFEYKSDVELYAYILAFCFGVDAREFWPATQSGATKADATVQNMKARGRMIGYLVQLMEWALRQLLPSTVEFEYDYTDDEQDEQQARIQGMRQTIYSTALRDGGINPLEYRALLIADGIIDGKLLESLDLPVTSDNAPASDQQDQALESNTDNTAEPQDENATGQMALKSADTYRKSLRSLVRAYWSGVFTAADFYTGTEDAVRRYFPQAWDEGAGSQGINPDERTEVETYRLVLEINTEISYIGGLAQAVAENSKANGGALSPLFQRVELWVNSYGRIENLAAMMAAMDGKSRWKYGDTVDHCPDCIVYQGRVYRNSIWQKYLDPYDALPRGKGLACGGWQCDCDFEPTLDPVTKGFPPKPRGPQKLFDTLTERVLLTSNGHSADMEMTPA